MNRLKYSLILCFGWIATACCEQPPPKTAAPPQFQAPAGDAQPQQAVEEPGSAEPVLDPLQLALMLTEKVGLDESRKELGARVATKYLELRQFEKAFAAAGGLSGSRLADFMIRAAGAYAADGDPDLALELAGQTEDSGQKSAAAAWIGFSLDPETYGDEAAGIFDALFKAEKDIADDWDKLRLLDIMVDAFSRTGRGDDSLKVLSRAAASGKKIKDPYNRGVLLLKIAQELERIGDRENAVDLLASNFKQFKKMKKSLAEDECYGYDAVLFDMAALALKLDQVKLGLSMLVAVDCGVDSSGHEKITAELIKKQVESKSRDLPAGDYPARLLEAAKKIWFLKDNQELRDYVVARAAALLRAEGNEAAFEKILEALPGGPREAALETQEPDPPVDEWIDNVSRAVIESKDWRYKAQMLLDVLDGIDPEQWKEHAGLQALLAGLR
ncbi:MAG: hypothetical protein ABIJ56_21505 [Pseudomonadota bacterium]